MSDLLTLRIRMAHSIDDGAVRFLLPDKHREDEPPLAMLERELRRIVDEEVAKATAGNARTIARLEEDVRRLNEENVLLEGQNGDLKDAVVHLKRENRDLMNEINATGERP